MRAPKKEAKPADFMPSEAAKGPRRSDGEFGGAEAVEKAARDLLSKIPGVEFIPGE